MAITVQVLMAVFAAAGFAIAKLHSFLSSPVGSDVMAVIAKAVQQKKEVEAHGKVQALAIHGLSLFNDLPIVKNAPAASAAQDSTPPAAVDPEWAQVLAQAKAAYNAKKAAGTGAATSAKAA